MAGVYFTVGGQTLTPDSSSNLVIAGQTLHPGSPALVISGTTYSLAPSNSALIVNGATQTPSTPTPGGVTGGALGVFFARGQTLTEDVASNIVISGQTLRPGSATVVGGTTYALAASGTALVVDG
ncbi:hypothetical protein LTR53_019342, partial [Teratosphaeriaceae sp. CCFEE 6253]